MTGRAAQQANRKLASNTRGLCKVHGWLGCHGKSCMTGQWDAADYMTYVTRMSHDRRNCAVNF